MTYYTSIIVLVWMALAILGILVKENDRFSREKKRILYATYLIIAAAAFFEWLGVQLNGNASVPAWLLRVVKLFDYILTPVAGGAFVLPFRTKTSFRKNALFAILAVNALYQIVSVFTGWMIVIDAGHRYAHGKGYSLYVLFYFLITVLVFLDLGLYGKRFRRRNRFSLYSILLFVAIGILLQEILGGEVRTAYLSLTLGVALLYIHTAEFSQLASDDRIQEQMIKISVDPLTGISSRYAYEEAIRKLSALPELPKNLVAFSIDVNGLKNTNDTLGHAAGDELICATAQTLASVFASCGRCYRVGGDEFIVLARIEKETIDELTVRLKEKTDAWRGKLVPALSVSVGSASAASHPDRSPEKLIAVADREMYRAKAAYYRAKQEEPKQE